MRQIKNILSPPSQYYGHKTCQRSYIVQGALTHRFSCPLNEVVM